MGVLIPAELLHARSQHCPLRIGERIAPQGYAKALASLVITSALEARAIDPRSARFLADQIVNGVAHLLSTDSDLGLSEATPMPGDRLLNVQVLLCKYLADPLLTVDRAAKSVGMSSRQLQRLFQSSGITFGDWLRRQRLDQCYAELVSSMEASVSITDVAFRWGFSDMSYFSRVFRSKFGVCARDVRGHKSWDRAGELSSCQSDTGGRLRDSTGLAKISRDCS